MKFRQIYLGAAVFYAGIAFPVMALAAGPHELPIREFAQKIVTAWVNHTTVVDAIKEQNARHATLSKEEIVAMDKVWRAETASAERPMIDQVLANDLSRFLAKASKEQHGLVTEIFVMDNRGLNVGQSDVTSDYWQGDEAKWQKTFLVGPKAMIIDDVELDELTQTFQSQMSMSIIDRATGDVIGAITVGVDVEAIVWATLDPKSN